MNTHPPVWKMVKEAVEHLGGTATYAQIKANILATYGDVNDSTMTCQIIVCSVNNPSRIHYPPVASLRCTELNREAQCHREY